MLYDYQALFECTVLRRKTKSLGSLKSPKHMFRKSILIGLFVLKGNRTIREPESSEKVVKALVPMCFLSGGYGQCREFEIFFCRCIEEQPRCYWVKENKCYTPEETGAISQPYSPPPPPHYGSLSVMATFLCPQGGDVQLQNICTVITNCCFPMSSPRCHSNNKVKGFCVCVVEFAQYNPLMFQRILTLTKIIVTVYIH